MATVTMDQALEVFQKHWKFNSFRESQEQVIAEVLRGGDVLAVLPTSYGKSAVFQVPALCLDGCAVVISPLIALMKDQCDDANKRGIPASFVNSHVDADEIEDRFEDFIDGAFKLFYVAPERIGTKIFWHSFAKADVSLVAIDEVHCHPAGTRIAMADGSYCAIERLRPGDVVLSFDGKRVTTRKIQQIQKKCVGRRKLLKIDTPSSTLVLTDDHPVYVLGKGDVDAKDVRAGNEVLLLQEAAVNYSRERKSVPCRVDSITVLEPRDFERDETGGYDYRTVYALTVETDHRYFAEDILTHNCASMWGHDFRPSYSQIYKIVNAVTNAAGQRPPVVAVTATATGDIEDDIVQAVGLRDDYLRVVGDPIRPNFSYRVQAGNPWYNLMSVMRRWDISTGRYVIYVATRGGASKVKTSLVDRVFHPNDSAVYHAGFTQENRTKVQDGFKCGDIPIIVATCAFGMGIDVPNIRSVVHFGIPGSLENFVQESGRAGRDGRNAESVVLADERSVDIQKSFIAMSNPPFHLYRDVWEFLHAVTEPKETLQMTMKEIAGSLGLSDWGADRMVSTVLNVMERQNLIRRAYNPSGTVIGYGTGELQDAVDGGELTKRQRKVASGLLREFASEGSGFRTVSIDKKTFAQMVGYSTATLSIALRELSEDGLIEVRTAFRGKTTLVTKRDADIDIELPNEHLQKKRDRAYARLARSIEYTELDSSERIAFLRNYFIKGLV